jgi:carboxyl-terminal processing protease
MNVRKAVGILITICSVCFIASGQSSIGSGPQSDPFILRKGGSFSASPSSVRPGSNSLPSRSINSGEIVSDLSEAIALISQHHASPTNAEKLTTSGTRGMLRSLDPHSSYYDPTEFRELLGEHKSEYSGTGAIIMSVMTHEGLETFIIAVADGSPAASASLKFGDKIIAVNDENVGGRSSYDVREAIRGPRGSSVKITVERSETRKIDTVVLKRERLPQPTIPYAFISDKKTGYIDLTVGFSFTTAAELKAAIRKLRSAGMEGLVIDLRGNGGGILEQAVASAEIFLPSGSKILSQRGRFVQENRDWLSKNRAPENVPLVLLVDGDTASAAEIFAAAMQDNDRAMIVGETTFGKGLVQNIIELENGGGLALTAARYFAPSGRSIQRDYSDGSLYDYFSKTNRAVIIERSEYAARTLTGRRVFGGNGVSHDVERNQDQTQQIDPDMDDGIFLFAREALDGRLSAFSSRNELRQHIIFNRDPVSEEMYVQLERTLGGVGSERVQQMHETESRVLRDRLRYYLYLGAFGQEEARKLQIINDPLLSVATDALHSANQLNQKTTLIRNSDRAAAR